jgi:hypothetical protein
VEFFNLFRWALILIVSVTIAFPLNVPLAALAYKVRNGPAPVPMEPAAFWGRATLAALVLAGLSLVTSLIDYVLVSSAEVPANVVHLGLVLAYLPAAVYIVFRVFELEDPFQALSLFVLYVCLPGLPLLLLYALFDLRLPFQLAEGWLAPVTSS